MNYSRKPAYPNLLSTFPFRHISSNSDVYCIQRGEYKRSTNKTERNTIRKKSRVKFKNTTFCRKKNK